MQMACTSQPIDFDTIHSTADGDGDGFNSSLDCDDDEPTISPGAQEVCDGIDNDCDGLIDEGLTSLWHLDEDGDGQGSSVSAIESCQTLLDRVTDDSDCDDTQASVYAGAPEVCDGMFNDCDDPDFTPKTPSNEIDFDADGFLACEDVNDDDPNICGDSDDDGCDDCSSGVFDPDDDGTDADGDGLCEWYSGVAAGAFHSCAINENDRIDCWGIGAQVQGQEAREATPCSADGGFDCGQAIPPAGDFLKISLGRTHSCAISASSDVVCWGAGLTDHYCPPIGLSSENMYECGQAAPPPGSFIEISAGRFWTCGIETDHTIACWGDNSNGATGPYASQGGPIEEERTFASIDSGLTHTCGVTTEGGIQCWGGGSAVGSEPHEPGTEFTAVSAGGGFSCAIDTPGEVQCWGGSSAVTNTVYAEFGGPVPDETKFSKVSSGAHHTCGISLEGELWCWGSSQYQQTQPYQADGGPIQDGIRFIDISAGDNHTCAIDQWKHIHCWGLPESGQTQAP